MSAHHALGEYDAVKAMLCELNVENLALIESLNLNFEKKGESDLVVMTGETGAGKSIMLRAISLLTGRRASVDWIRSGADSCSVEALFEVSEDHQEIHYLLESGGFSDGSTVIIRRVLNNGGRSRFYINGSLATAKVVSEICSHLLNIAGQHDHQQLLQPGLHLDFLDTLGDLQAARNDYRKRYDNWRANKEILDELRSRDRDREQRLDFLTYQLQEIREAAPVSGEDEELVRERNRLKSADSLIKVSRECYGIMSSTITDELARVRKYMEQLAELDPDAQELAGEIGEYAYLAEDHSARLRDYCNQLENDPIRLEAVVERLDVLQSLKRKYGETLEAVLRYADESEQELKQIENLDREIEAQEKKTEESEQRVIGAAQELSRLRRQTAKRMEKAMELELGSLAFNKAMVSVNFKEHENDLSALRPTGFDRVEFFFAPNPGEPARPLAKVASGGELSRLMLALKCLLAKKDMVETVIFDEVDAGIGGEAAEAVARKIQELSGHHQVFCITHLPQIAARGTEHLRVEKAVMNGRTQSTVIPLGEEERVGELARMLAGDSATSQTHAWAQELLEKGKNGL